jgi:hypothetical protein
LLARIDACHSCACTLEEEELRVRFTRFPRRH